MGHRGKNWAAGWGIKTWLKSEKQGANKGGMGGEELSKQREQHVQGPCGRTEQGTFKELKEGKCDQAQSEDEHGAK